MTRDQKAHYWIAIACAIIGGLIFVYGLTCGSDWVAQIIRAGSLIIVLIATIARIAIENGSLRERVEVWQVGRDNPFPLVASRAIAIAGIVAFAISFWLGTISWVPETLRLIGIFLLFNAVIMNQFGMYIVLRDRVAQQPE